MLYCALPTSNCQIVLAECTNGSLPMQKTEMRFMIQDLKGHFITVAGNGNARILEMKMTDRD